MDSTRHRPATLPTLLFLLALGTFITLAFGAPTLVIALVLASTCVLFGAFARALIRSFCAPIIISKAD